MRTACMVFILLFVVSFCSCGNKSDKVDVKNSILAVNSKTAVTLAAEEYSSKGMTFAEYDNYSDCILALENSKADFTILDSFQYINFTNSQRSISLVEKCSYKTDYCAYFSKDNEDLCDEFNWVLEELKDDGTVDEIFRKYALGEGKVSVDSADADKVITILSDLSFEKRACCDSDGNAYGTDIDIAKTIFKRLGYSVEIKEADFDELFLMLENGEGDVIVSATEYNESRAESYLASDTYLTIEYYLVERKTEK